MTQMLKCPRCLRNTFYEEEVMNALSRMDNESYICGDCGLYEAFHLKNENKFGEYWVMYFPMFHPNGYGVFKGAKLVGARPTEQEAVEYAKELSKSV
jgi:hypothetical protein